VLLVNGALLIVAGVLLAGILEVALDVLALAGPGATVAALITVAGIWAAAVGVSRVALAFQVKRLPAEVERASKTRFNESNGHAPAVQPSRAMTPQS
jgi:hypothetical protein